MLRNVLIMMFTVVLLTACGSEDKVNETVDTPKNVVVKTMQVKKRLIRHHQEALQPLYPVKRPPSLSRRSWDMWSRY